MNIEVELDQSFVSPQRTYKGETLAPYTEGSRMLLMQTRTDNDSEAYFLWSFLFLHIHLAKNRREAIKIAWDKNAFRESLMDWVSDKSEEDREIAVSLVTSIIDEANKSRIETIPQPGDGASGGN